MDRYPLVLGNVPRNEDAVFKEDGPCLISEERAKYAGDFFPDLHPIYHTILEAFDRMVEEAS